MAASPCTMLMTATMCILNHHVPQLGTPLPSRVKGTTIPSHPAPQGSPGTPGAAVAGPPPGGFCSLPAARCICCCQRSCRCLRLYSRVSAVSRQVDLCNRRGSGHSVSAGIIPAHRKQESSQPGRQAGRQAGKQEGRQAGGRAGLEWQSKAEVSAVCCTHAIVHTQPRRKLFERNLR